MVDLNIGRCPVGLVEGCLALSVLDLLSASLVCVKLDYIAKVCVQQDAWDLRRNDDWDCVELL